MIKIKRNNYIAFFKKGSHEKNEYGINGSFQNCRRTVVYFLGIKIFEKLDRIA